MNLVVRFLPFWLGLSSLLGAGTPAGLWHLIDSDKLGTIGFLHSDGQSWVIYDQSWSEISRKVSYSGGSLQIEVPVVGSTSPMHLTGSFEKDDGLKGHFSRFHVQYELKGRWHGRRIAATASWKRWAFLVNNTDGIVDIGSLVLDRKETDGSTVQSVWDSVIEEEYYPLLTPTLYSTYQGVYYDSVRRDHRAELFTSLEATIDKKSWREAAGRVEKVKADLRRAYPWLSQELVVVLLPMAGNCDFRFVRLDNGKRHFLLLNLEWWAKHSAGPSRDYLIAQALLYGIIRGKTNLPESIQMEILRRGIASYLSKNLRYSERTADVLFTGPGKGAAVAKDYEEFKKKIARGAGPLSLGYREYFLTSTRHLSYYLGYQAAGWLSKRFSASEMVSIRFQMAIPLMKEFLNSSEIEILPVS
jgi:hypothetical protein